MKLLRSIPLTWLTGILLTLACEKPPIPPPPPNIQVLAPPQPIAEDTVYVSASFPGYTLWSVDGEEIGSGISKYFLLNGTIQWKCLVKPNQAPSPKMEFPNLASTAISQLVKGEYVFEVTYSTDAGSKHALSHIFVVEDRLPNGSLVLPPQSWQKFDISSFPDADYWVSLVSIENSPDLFCYRQGKKIKVEIQDVLNNVWKEVFADDNDGTGSGQSNPNFYIYQHKNMVIEYNHQTRTDTTMDRLVTQKVAIRLSY